MILLDASALISLIKGEEGSALVLKAVESGAAISSVNFSETLTVLKRYNVPEEESAFYLDNTGISILPFLSEHATVAAGLWNKTRPLSFGDRACLATAKCEKIPVLTADNEWYGLKLGINIRFIR